MNFSHIPHPDEDLLHYGVKGMKWGVRQARSDSGGNKSPSNRQLNKQSRQADKAKRKADRQEFKGNVRAARARLKSGEAKARMKQAKRDYKVNKTEMGSREARKILQKERDRRAVDYAMSRQVVDGKSFARELLYSSLGAPTPLVSITKLDKGSVSTTSPVSGRTMNARLEDD